MLESVEKEMNIVIEGMVNYDMLKKNHKTEN